MLIMERKGRKVGTGSFGTEGMGVMGGDTHRKCWDGRQCCVMMAEQTGRKVGKGSFGTEGLGVMGTPSFDARIVNLLPCFGNKASLVTSRQSLRLYLNPVALPCLSQFLF